MFKNANGKLVIRYRIPSPDAVLFDDSDLWETPTPEYRAWNFPDMILSIVEVKKRTNYSFIAQVLAEHNVPIDLGYVVRGIDELVESGKIERIRGQDSILVLIKQ